MSIFSSSFFSIAGQAERLANVGNVLKSALNPFDKNKITANVGNPAGKAALEFVANNPYTTAAIAATAGTAAARQAVVSSVAKLSLVTKIVGGGAALVAAPAIISSPRTQAGALTLASQVTPEKLVKLGSGIGKTVEQPDFQQGKTFLSENKGTLGVIAAAGAAVLGTKAVMPYLNYKNIQETQKNTKALYQTQEIPKETAKATEKAAEAEADAAVEIAKIQAKAAKELAEEQTKQARIQAEEATKQAKLLSRQPVAAPIAAAQPIPEQAAIIPTTKKAAPKKKGKKKKKRGVKKKKKSKKSRKAYKARKKRGKSGK